MSTKTWLITGATSGFGRQLAEAVAERGDIVIATGRRRHALAELAATSSRITPVVADVTTGGGITAITTAVTTAGGIDVLVNNAGYGLFGAVEEITDETTRRVFETHVFGPLALIRATLPSLRERHGHVINLSSQLAVYAWPASGLYSASKSALELISDALAQEVAPAGVSVTAIQPGTYGTEFVTTATVVAPSDVYTPTVGAFLNTVSQLGPDTMGNPQEVVDAILFAADAQNPPLRIAVGDEARTSIRTALQKQLDELENTARITNA
jgi:NAD(P)-dependent dehydrogenase (short-subunit alcohol dehydrogenase family)